MMRLVVRSVRCSRSCTLAAQQRGPARLSSTARPGPITGGSSRVRRLLWTLPSLTFALGTWQVFRLRWKTRVLDAAEQCFSEDPVELPPTAALLAPEGSTSLDAVTHTLDTHHDGNESQSPLASTREFRRVKVRGCFHPTKFLLVGPRARAQDSEPGATGPPFPGYYVVAPFKRSDDHEVILVNLGFIPKEHPWLGNEHIPKDITIEGIIRESETVSRITLRNDPEKGEWLWLDTQDMAKALNAQPIMIELLDLPGTSYASILDEDGLPSGRKTFKGIPNRHLEYVLTWYGLSAIGCVLMTVF